MNQAYLRVAVEQMQQQGIGFEAGLSDREVESAQNTFGFQFPPDLRQFLQMALPVSVPPEETEEDISEDPYPFPNWRSDDEERIREWLDGPFEGICFDIQYNRFWQNEWGARPASDEAAFVVAREQVRQAPTMIPFFGHRFMPDAPHTEGNPVFSIVQTDIVYYGYDLPHYLMREFGIFNSFPEPPQPRRIAFWSDMPFMWNPNWD